MRVSGWVATGAAVFISAISATASAQPAPIGWSEAITRLAAERTNAVGCAEIAHRRLPAAAAAQLGARYTTAKAEIDGVIAGLSIALAERREPSSLPDLERRMSAGFDGRMAFCKAVDAQLPKPPTAAATRGPIADFLGGTLGEVLEAVVALAKLWNERDNARSALIRDELEATRWPAYADTRPASR